MRLLAVAAGWLTILVLVLPVKGFLSLISSSPPARP
jgi:hypothetical protein